MCPGHKVSKYACVDDSPDFLEGQPLFKTDFMERGLDKELAEEIVNYFNG